jgi:hypothetical protein
MIIALQPQTDAVSVTAGLADPSDSVSRTTFETRVPLPHAEALGVNDADTWKWLRLPRVDGHEDERRRGETIAGMRGPKD